MNPEQISPQFRKLGPRDYEWHEAFHRYIDRIFPRVSFRQWCEYGGWTDDYMAFALTVGTEIVANASLQRMTVLVDGHELNGWQLGAVGVVPEWRGRGLQRQIMPLLLEVPQAGDIVYLFANRNVLEFYPKFGFERIHEQLFGIDCHVTPAPQRLPRLAVEQAEHRALLGRLTKSAPSITHRFGARNYGEVLLWYWTNFYRACFYYSQETDTIVVAEQDGDLLRIVDVLSAHPVDLPRLIPGIIAAPTGRLEFGFTPELLWPDARPLRDCEDSPLFVKKDLRPRLGAFKYPELAQT